MRLVAAITVLIGHHFIVAAQTPRPAPIPGFGDIGVVALAVFFVISGYFIAGSWERDPNALRYWIRRSLRIFPALGAVVAVTILVIGPAVTQLGTSAYLTSTATWAYAKNAVMAFGMEFRLPGVFTGNPQDIVNVSLWSLPIEMLMYCLIFLIGFTVGRHARWFYPATAVALGVAWWLIPGNEMSPGLQTFNLGVFFMVGATIAVHRSHFLLSQPAVIASAVLVVSAIALDNTATKPLLWLTFPVLVLGIGMRPSRLGTWVSARGDISYGYYLWAFPIQQLVVMLMLPQIGFWTSLVVAMLLTGVCAAVSWRFIERPALSVKSSAVDRVTRWSNGGRPKTSVAA